MWNAAAPRLIVVHCTRSPLGGRDRFTPGVHLEIQDRSTGVIHVQETTRCIVGAGPAGMILGLLLARAGVTVTVLESIAAQMRRTSSRTTLAELQEQRASGPARAGLVGSRSTSH
jgi:hypothetical protein